MKFYFLAFLYLNTPLCGMAQITDQYPELISFFSSVEFQTRCNGCEIVSYDGLDEGIANLHMELSSEGKKFQLRISSSIIDKKLFSAEEIKFIIGHELGHKNDKNMLERLLLFEIMTLASRIATLSTFAYLCVKKKWDSALKKGAMFPAIFFVGSFLKAKVSRNCEFFADEYAVKFTKNKEAALSALEKRSLFVPEKQHAYTLLKDLDDLFQDHPTVKARCDHIRAVKI